MFLENLSLFMQQSCLFSYNTVISIYLINLIEPKLYMNRTKNLIELILDMNHTKNLIEPKLLLLYLYSIYIHNL
jgi:hypothetical protein